MSKSILTPLAVPAHLNPENVQVRMAGTPDNSCRRFCGVRAELPEPTLELIDQYPDKKIRATAIVHV